MADTGLQTLEIACPYLGLPNDPDSHFTFPDGAHVCLAKRRPAPIDPGYQASFCLSEAYRACRRFASAQRPVPPHRDPAAFPLFAATPPAQTEPLPTPPAQTEPLPTAPAQTEPLPTAPAQTEPLPTAPAQTEPLPTAPAQTEPDFPEGIGTNAPEPVVVEPAASALPVGDVEAGLWGVPLFAFDAPREPDRWGIAPTGFSRRDTLAPTDRPSPFAAAPAQPADPQPWGDRDTLPPAHGPIPAPSSRGSTADVRRRGPVRLQAVPAGKRNDRLTVAKIAFFLLLMLFVAAVGYAAWLAFGGALPSVPGSSPTAIAVAVVPVPTASQLPGPSASGSLVPTPTPATAPTPGPTPTPTELPTPSPTPTSAPTPSPTPSPTGGPTIYTIKHGDTLGSIARKFGVSEARIIKVNHLKNPDHIVAGQHLIIPNH